MWSVFSGFGTVRRKNAASHRTHSLGQPIPLIDDKCVWKRNPHLGRHPLSTAAELREDIL